MEQRKAGDANSSSPEKITISRKVLAHRAKFFGSGTSEEDVVQILSESSPSGDSFKVPSSPIRSPAKSPKKKTSPIQITRNHPIKNFVKSSPKKSPSPNRSNIFYSPQKSPVSNSSPKSSPSSSPVAKKRLSFPGSPSKSTTEAENPASSDGKNYFDSFYHIVQTVRSDEKSKMLFTEEELNLLNNFSKHRPELHLYVRLINRIDSWKASSSISYPEIASDLEPLFAKLQEEGYITCDMSKEPLKEVLNILKVDDLKNLCKLFKVQVGADQKELKIDRLLKFSRTQVTIFSATNPLRKHAEELLGRCFRLSQSSRLLFRRCLLFFSLFHSVDELDKLFQTQNLLLMQVSRKLMIFPISAADVWKNYDLYDNRDQFLRYEKARELRQDLFNAGKELDVVEELTKVALKEFENILALDDEKSVTLLPPFLRRYRASYVYARLLENAAETLRTKQNVDLARQALLALQKHSTYLPSRAGQWAVSMATLLQVNCKNNIAAAEELCRGLKLPDLNMPSKIALTTRAEILLKRKKDGLKEELANKLRCLLDPPLENPVTVDIQARSTNMSKPGMKRIYVRTEGDGGRVFRSVEEEALSYYRDLGYQGRHDEGSMIRSLCLLSMWNIIYDVTQPRVFLSQYQDRPLDWGSPQFYEARRQQIEDRFEVLKVIGEEGLTHELVSTIAQHAGTVSLIVWEALENVAFKDVLDCLTIDVFTAICRRLLQDNRAHRSGFPDLTMWNIEKKKCMFAEVKGPGDTLSPQQILWLNFLRSHGIEAVVANVRVTGSKEAKS